MANITGTDASEWIQGTANDAVIDGRGGDDVIGGGDGSDILRGGDGNDQLREVSSGAGIEHHQMFGDAGDDVLVLDLRPRYADIVLLDGGIGNDRIIFDAWHSLHALTIAATATTSSISPAADRQWWMADPAWIASNLNIATRPRPTASRSGPAPTSSI